MPETDRILDQLNRAYRGHSWHGPSVMEALEGVTADRALARPLPAAHNIWELLGHIAVWKAIALDRLNGGRREPTDAENFPPGASADDAAWRAALAGLDRDHEALCAAVPGLDEGALNLDLPQVQGLSPYRLLHGVVQHDLYHAGQIVLLRKG